MGNGLENPTVAPRPLCETMPNAVRTAIRFGNTIADINLPRWSQTYGDCGVEAIRNEWERQASEASRQPNNFEEFDK